MNGNIQNRLVSSALEKLKRAALSVLSEQYVEGRPDESYLRIADTRERLGLPKLVDHQSLTRGILTHLVEDGRAEKIVGRRGLWQITEKGISFMEAQVSDTVSSELEVLKRTALGVLSEQYVDGRPDESYLRIADIRERLGLPKLVDHQSLTRGVLMHLAAEGHAEWLDDDDDYWRATGNRILSRESGVPDLVSSGLATLKRTALEALYEQYVEGQPDKPYLLIRILRDRSGLPKPKQSPNNDLTHGVLMHLAEDGHAEWLGEGGRWQITEKGISSMKA